MARLGASGVRAAWARKNALSLEKTPSMGWQSGLSRGKKSTRAPVASIFSTMARVFVHAQVVQEHDLAGV